MNLDKVREVCASLAVRAGEEIMKIYDGDNGVDVSYKEDRSPLTAADKASNAVIVEGLKREFPEAAILSEEEKDDLKRLDNPYCFVVDPLDGTKEFLKRNGQFTVNIALAYEKRPVVGVVYVPVTKELYFAVKGQGAFMQKDGSEIEAISVSKEIKEKSDLRVVMSNSHGCEAMDALMEKYQFKNTLKVGSSLKGIMVARGEADVYYRFNPTMEWDTAAMHCIVEEAGGIFRQMDHSEMLYNRVNSLNDKGFYIINIKEHQLLEE